ncbi:aquaporin-12 [Biomphalaria glabrata]|nr:aquaporin-12-like [Biomphalaria glabrata]
MQADGWRGLYSLFTGHEPTQEFLEPYMASILYFTINMATGVILRALSAAFLPPSIRGLAMDFVSTMETCAYFFENNFVLKMTPDIGFQLTSPRTSESADLNKGSLFTSGMA